MKIGRGGKKARARNNWLKGYWERRKAKKQEQPDEIKCVTCNATCTKKTKGVTVGRCSRNAKKAGQEKPECNFTD